MSELSKTLAPESSAKYDRGYKWLHWIMAALVLLMLLALLGFSQKMTTDEHMTMLIGHSSIGTVISLLLLIRVVKRFVKRDPRPVQQIAHWQQVASKVVQLGLYFCLIFIPLTGYLTARFHELPVMVFGSFNINNGHDQATFDTLRSAHEWAINLIMVLLVLHIGAALYHRLVKKDGVLASMTTAK